MHWPGSSLSFLLFLKKFSLFFIVNFPGVTLVGTDHTGPGCAGRLCAALCVHHPEPVLFASYLMLSILYSTEKSRGPLDHHVT